MKRTSVVRYYSAGVMAVLGYVSYACFTQPVDTTQKPVAEQKALYHNVPKVNPGPPPTAAAVREGEALAVMRIPRFGSDWLWTVVEGTDLELLAGGPGHFTGTALPGAQGNSAYAGHRTGYGDPLIDIDRLRPGDDIIVAQDGAEWTYEVTMHPKVIDASEGWIVNNMQKGRWLTLVTCEPKFTSEDRIYVRAVLQR